MTLVAADDVLTLSALLLILTFLGLWADGNKIGQRTSGALWVLVGGILLSNFGVVPFESATYGFVFSVIVPVAIPLLLLKADFRKIFRETGKLLIIFLLGSVTVVIGALIGFFLLDLGTIGPKVAGVYTGGWVGGTVNFVAVSQAVGLTGTDFAVAMSASNPVSIIALMTLLAIPAMPFFKRAIPTTYDLVETAVAEDAEESVSPPFRSVEIAAMLALSLSICAASSLVARWIGWQYFTIVVITCVTLFVANIFPRQMARFKTDFDLGMFLMYIFFASIGMTTNASSFISNAFNLFVYGMIIVTVHIALVLVAAKLLKIDLAVAIVASAANVMGPVPAAAIASARGWKPLVTPAVMCGIFGYAIATFIGIGVTNLLN